jgi:glucokinase
MTVSRHLGIDLGGTNIKAAVLEYHDAAARPELIDSRTVATLADLGPDGVADRIIHLGHEVRNEFEGISSVGLGVPGLFNASSGSIELFPNLPGAWGGFRLLDVVRDGLGVTPAMLNDARAFTLAEGTMGAGRGAKVMLGITLGTGIGGGLMIDGRLHLGAFGTAGEFGHQTVEPEGPVCGCGNRGCLEAVAKGETISSEAGVTDVEALLSAAVAGDETATRILDRASFHMAIAIANAVSLIGVDVVVVGGGVASSGELVLAPLRAAVANRVTLVPTDGIRIVAAELGPMAGAIGAALAGRGQVPTRSL